MEHIAIDLGGRASQICVRSSDGRIREEHQCATAALKTYLGRKLQHSSGWYATVAGIQLKDIAPNANVKISDTVGRDSTWGMVVRNSADVAGGPPAVRIVGSAAVINEQGGLRFENADGMLVQRTSVSCNGPHGDTCDDAQGIGIEVDADSEGNTFIANVVEYQAVNVIDAGSNNCWKSNFFGVGFEPPLGCP